MQANYLHHSKYIGPGKGLPLPEWVGPDERIPDSDSRVGL